MKSVKRHNHIGNRTCGLSTCSAVPQLTAPPHNLTVPLFPNLGTRFWLAISTQFIAYGKLCVATSIYKERKLHYGREKLAIKWSYSATICELTSDSCMTTHSETLFVAWIYTYALSRIFSYYPPSPHGFILCSLGSTHKQENTEDLTDCLLQWEHHNRATFASNKIKICEVWGQICEDASLG
jgi:hypothetical protein